MYYLKDVSVVIPTYNRSEDLKITLNSIIRFKDLGEVIIVDQSKDSKTKKVVSDFKSKRLKYVYSKTPAITIARNLGVKEASKKSKIICFIDDDVTLGNNYFEEILKVFNADENAMAVAGYDLPRDVGSWSGRTIAKIFRLGHFEKNRARIISAYGNTYYYGPRKVSNVQWLPGVNMAYIKGVFDEQKFDENLLGYTIGEDIDFSYRLWKKHPNSVFITPLTKFKHRFSEAGRYLTERMAYVNQIDHFYFNYKNLNNNLGQKIIFTWSLIGIMLLRTGSLFSFKKINYLKWKYFFKSLFYCLGHIKEIKNGKLREFEK
jgi:glycosyltransferase involved in cell wall biosynthesis